MTSILPRLIPVALWSLLLGCNPAAREVAKKPQQQAVEEVAPPAEAEQVAPAEPVAESEPEPIKLTDDPTPDKKTKQPEEPTMTDNKKHAADVMAAAADTPLIPRKVLFGNPDRATAKISPDGRRLAFLAPVKGVLNVWVAAADVPDKARPVTRDKLRGIRTYFWAYTNDHIIYVQDVGGDENWHVYLVDLATGDTTDLTPLAEVNAQVSGMSHRLPGQIVVSLNDRDPNVHDLYRIDLDSRERTLVEKNTENFTGYVLDDDLRVRFATRMQPDGGSELLRKDGQRWAKFISIPREDTLTTQPVGFDKRGDVLYLIDSRRRNTGALTAIDLAGGKQTLLAENELADLGEVLAHPTENTIEAVSFNYLRKEWQPLADETKDDFDYLHTVADGEITIGSQSLDNQKWIVAYLLDNGPVKYFLYDREAKQATFLFNNRDDLEGRPLAKMRPVEIKSRDGLTLVSYLTLPPWVGGNSNKGKTTGTLTRAARLTRPLPMVLDVHGGPWARDEWGFNPLHQWLANRGYAVLSVNFRGSTGLGKEFTNAGNREWAGKMHDDLIDAVEWAVREGIADRDRIAIMGGSYGGYATLVGLTFTPDTFACGIDIVGPSNILTLLSSIPPYWQPMVQMFKDRVGDFNTRQGNEFLESRSPLTHVGKIARPLLIGQGANDPRVKQAESDQIVRLMQKKNIPVTYVLYPDEGHGFARPENRLSFNAVAEAFLAEHLGGRFEPIGDDFSGASITVPAGAEGVPGLEEALARRGEK